MTNGNKVTVVAARLALAFVNRHRGGMWQSNGEVHDVDAFPLKRIGPEGVQIGCTLIPWSEVDRCAELLREPAQDHDAMLESHGLLEAAK
nr:hypothetical protein [uncultured Rhodopila sp.]